MRWPPTWRVTAPASSQIAGRLRTATAALPQRFTRRLEERLAPLRQQPGFDPGRLAQEAALMAERLDVTEELVRLDTHLRHLGELLTGSGAVGRKLDFVVQEMGRELNTVGSKAQDAAVSGPGDRRQGGAGEDPRAGSEYRVMTRHRRGSGESRR